jgi:hypothetical protein
MRFHGTTVTGHAMCSYVCVPLPQTARHSTISSLSSLQSGISRRGSIAGRLGNSAGL